VIDLLDLTCTPNDVKNGAARTASISDPTPP